MSSNYRTSLVAQWLKNPPANEGDVDLIPGLGRNPGGGNGNPLQYSCLENPMDGGVQSQSIINNAITETKSTLEGTNSRITEAEDRISEVEYRMVE